MQPAPQWQPRVVPWDPGPIRGTIWDLGRLYATWGWSRDDIVARLTETHGPMTGSGIRTQEIGRAATYGVRWRIEMHGLVHGSQDAAIDRRLHSERSADEMPTAYRYTVTFLQRDLYGNITDARSVVVNADARLTVGQVHERALSLFTSVAERYARFAIYGLVNEDTDWQIAGAQRRN